MSDLKKASQKKDAARKKRMNSYKREADQAKAVKAKENANRTSTPTTEEEAQRNGYALFIVLGLILLAILYFTIGPIGILIIAGIAVLILVLYIVRETKRDKDKPRVLSQEEIDELQRHLANIDVYKNVANTSSDSYAVQCAMDELLRSIDFIMSYVEEELHQAGMSKEKLPEQREFIVQHYDEMIAQAREQGHEDKWRSI